MPEEPEFARRQRVASYAVILRGEEVLLSRLAPYLTSTEQWTLPGGGIDFGEDPRDAVVREVYEETGIDVAVGDRAWVDSARRVISREETEMHSVRMVFEGWAPVDAPEPHVVEVDGSTIDARWIKLSAVLDGSCPVVPWVRAALEEHTIARVQRIAAKGLARRGDTVLLIRLSPLAVESGQWTLPGGGVGHGERPAKALAREMLEETGLDAEVGTLIGVHDAHFTGTAPSGRHEDFHAIDLVFEVRVPDAEPRVLETGGTTDAAAWVDLVAISSGALPVTDVVRFALASAP